MILLLLFCQEGREHNVQVGEEKEATLKERLLALAGDEIYYSVDLIESRKDGDEYADAMAGNIILLGRNIRVSADRAVVWRGQKKDLETRGEEGEKGEKKEGDLSLLTSVKSLYVEGNVTIRTGSEIVRAERAYYDFSREKAIFIDGYLSRDFPLRRLQVPLYVRASRIRQLSKGIFKAENATLTNCSFSKPHWYIRTRDIDLWESGENETSFKTGPITCYSHGIPFFWLPGFKGSFREGADFILNSVRVGRSSKFGFYLLTEWGQKFDFLGVKDWGEWALHLDEKTKRGPGIGPEVKYGEEAYFGRVRTYYQRDHGEDRNKFPFESEDRGRIRFQHRHFLPFGLQADGEFQWMSDPNFMREFFEGEFKEDKDPETYFLLKKNFDNHSLRFLERVRINDFFSQTEYLPQLSYHLIQEPLLPRPFWGTNLYLSTNTEFSNVRYRPSELLNKGILESRRMLRFDSENAVNLPLHFGPAVFSPFLRVRYSLFEETLNEEDSKGRVLQGAGFRATTQLYRVYDVKNRALMLNGVRHIINPEIRFLNVFDVNVPPEELFPFDEVEAVDEVALLRFTLRNRLQTRLGREVFDFLDTDLGIDYFPFERRDNRGREWGNLRWDLRARIGPRVGFLIDSEFNFDAGDFDKLTVGTRFSPSQGVFVGVGQRILRKKALATYCALSMNLTEKWSAQGILLYDFKTGRTMDHKIVFRRLAHCWVFEIGFEIDRGERDTRVSFSIYPLSLLGRRKKVRGFGEESYMDENLSEGYYIYEED